MTKKFRNTYRVESARLKGWDYSSEGAYFVTILTHGKKNFFGRIQDGKMSYSEIGIVACKCWTDIPNHFPFVKLGAWVVMPDHVHGILRLHEKHERENAVDYRYDPEKLVDPSYFLKQSANPNKFGPQSRNLGSIIRGYKIGVKKYAVINKIDFSWHPRYHDRVIRDENEYYWISKYIRENPESLDKR